ncbi:phosphate permease [Pyrococcus furiosus DSM 3638]|uniref:Putative phosphate permease PF1020 n=3 Tax=Pyrococcus furiosus TaxID=2261 RepID=Y1020_PYRFU|nr:MULTISPECIES: inorganic phosphate transporter [Pyrococcus]Q8U230.1 RecName: Full=Putative phosphate permease PF1020 [Pyrococcus furiosus DSM 3638]AAL81144.1 putative phosphate transport protein pitb [Pyrococcus furiosus DSM 3638]AFN03816.1 phosphate transport protein pitb [Pyrococcus furiosus COM1]MDK2868854.1 inorganic phosphate transporter, PiT family [Pyrococcus sp.]QEK78683.1 phosphate permease [Pyrococcus furiosus DSM 3638]
MQLGFAMLADPILLITILLGFAMAWAIGANDAANSMSTAVGAGAITPRQAVIIAGVLEFMGAYFFGKTVTETIRKGIIDPSKITDPNVLIFGSIAALIGATIWLVIATKYGLPVSTTHSIIGGIVGYGIVYGGMSIVNWDKMIKVVLSWILSPIVGAIFAYLVFRALSKTVLQSKDPVKSAKRWSPFWIGLAFVVIGTMFYIKVLHGNSLLEGFLKYGMPAGILTFIVVSLILEKRFPATDPYLGAERVFRRVQVITSAYVALAHGANDVANAIGPVAAVYTVAMFGLAGAKVPVPRWILALGGLGIAIGVATYGYKVMETVGKKITELTNTRGFTIDFSAATVVLIASWLGMPISTTHTVVGAVIGVGLARGIKAINKDIVKDIIISWFVTVPAAGVIAGIIFKALMMLMG